MIENECFNIECKFITFIRKLARYSTCVFPSMIQRCSCQILKSIQERNSVAYFWLTNLSLLFATDFQANPNDISWKNEKWKISQSEFMQHYSNLGCPLVKFGLSEKHTKFEKNLPRGFDKSADLLIVNVKTMRKIFSHYVCFSESPTFNLLWK